MAPATSAIPPKVADHRRAVIAATELVGGFLAICLDSATGPIVALYPRTFAGLVYARRDCERLSQ